MELKEKIIVALDASNLNEVEALVKSLIPYVKYFKIGFELMTAVGAPSAIELVHSLGGEVFLDGKFNDIPNTVARAAKAAASLNVKMFDVHASAGADALAAAVANKGSSMVFVVTVLGSLDEKNVTMIFGASSKEKTLQFSRDAKAARAEGIICSAQELEFLGKHRELDGLMKITPGIRPTWASANDQRRSMTPKDALAAGATMLVIGRPITHPPKEIGMPADAIQRIIQEIA